MPELRAYNFLSRFTFGDIVYIKTDPEQLPWMVCEIEFRPVNTVVYHISSGKELYTAYEFELSDSMNKELKMGI